MVHGQQDNSRPPRRSVVVGNPPFGHRAWLALAFVNHAAMFAEAEFVATGRRPLAGTAARRRGLGP